MQSREAKNCLKGLDRQLQKSDAFILAQHGPVVAGTSLMDAFYGLEELEESCRIALEINRRAK